MRKEICITDFPLNIHQNVLFSHQYMPRGKWVANQTIHVSFFQKLILVHTQPVEFGSTEIFPRKTKSVKRFYKIHIYTWMYFYRARCLPEQKYIARACSACILIFSQIADTLPFRNFATSHVIVDNGNMKCFYLRCSLLTVQMTTINRESKQMNVTLQVITLFLQKPTLLLKHTKLVAFQ